MSLCFAGAVSVAGFELSLGTKLSLLSDLVRCTDVSYRTGFRLSDVRCMQVVAVAERNPEYHTQNAQAR
jgi:hypothetical protein